MTPSESSFQIAASPYLGGESVFASFPAGLSIEAALGHDVALTVRVTVGGVEVPRSMWGKVRPRSGAQVIATLEPQGGGGGKVLRLVAVAVLTYFTAGAGATWAAGWAGSYAGAVYAGAFVLGSLAINALIPPPSTKVNASGDPFQQLNSLTGTSNQAAPYQCIPCVLGTSRMYPPHAALPYTEISGKDQYLRMLLDFGFGDLDISDMKIGETPIANYDDVQWEIGTAPSLFTQDIYELNIGTALNTSGAVDTRSTQGGSTEISLDLVFGNGLYGINKKGRNVTGTTSFSILYRPVGTTSWTSVTAATGLTLSGGLRVTGSTITASSSERAALRTGVRWTVAKGQYDVQITRNATSFDGAQDGATQGDCAWTVLRSISPQLPSTTGTTKIAIRIKATDQLQGVVQNFSAVVAQRVPKWDATARAWTASVSTNNPAWIYLWLLTRCPAVVRRLTDDRVALDDIAAWAAECDAKGLVIGTTVDSARQLGDLLRDVLAAGRASFGVRNGRYTAIRDLPQAAASQMFTPKNSWGFNYARSFDDLPHALRVKFTNPQAAWQEDVVTVYWDGYDASNATRFEELDLRLVIDPIAAWRLGRYHLAVMRYRPTTYTFSADIEHMPCERGDLVTIAHDIIGRGIASGRIRRINGDVLVVDEELSLTPGKRYVVRVRRQNATQAVADGAPEYTWDSTYITFDNPDSVLALSGPTSSFRLSAPVGAQVGDLYVIGEQSREVLEVVIKSIVPGKDFSAEITCVDAAPAILDADAGVPPPFVSDITGTSWCEPPDPPSITVRIGTSSPDDTGAVSVVSGVSGSPRGGIYRMPITAPQGAM